MAANRFRLSAVLAKFLCLAVFLAVASTALCQTESVTLKSIRGPFHPFSSERTWTQKICEVQNDASRNLSLSVKTTATDDKLGRLEFRRDFTSPANSIRQVTVGMRFGSFARIAAGSRHGQTKSGMSKFGQTFIIQETGNERQLSLQESILLGVPDKTLHTAVVNGDNGDSFAYMKDDGSNPLGNILFISAGNVENLPTNWYGYELLDMLMVGPVDDSKLLPSQFTAMEQWVRKGGRLLIFCGEGSFEQLQGRLGRLAGVHALGFHHTDRLNVDGQTYTLAKPTYFAELAADGATVLETCDTLPLLTAKRTGMGVVMVAACSLQALQPQGNFNVWKNVAVQVHSRQALDPANFSNVVSVKETVKVDKQAEPVSKNKATSKKFSRHRPASPRYVDKTRNVIPGFATLQEIAGRQAPSSFIPCGILLGFVFATLALGGLLRILRKGELLWIFLIPAVAVMSVVIFQISRHTSDTARLSNVGYVAALGDGQSYIQEFYAFYSGPDASDVDFGSKYMNGIIMPAGENRLANMTTQTIVTGDSQMFMPEKGMKSCATTSFFTETVAAYDPMSASLSFDSAGATIKIKNNLKQPVNNAVLFSNMLVMKIGNIAPGENIIRMNTADKLAEGEFTSSLMTQDTKWNELISLMLDHGGFHRTITAPRLLGYLDGSAISPLAQTANVKRQGVSVIDIPVTFSPVKSGTEVTIPAALLPSDVMNLEMPVWNTTARKFNSCIRPSKFVYLLGLPENIKKLKKASVELAINLQASGYVMKVSRISLTPGHSDTPRRHFNTVALQVYLSVDNPSGVYNISIPDADKLAVHEGKMAICIELSRLKSDIAQTISAINISGSSNQAMWKIISITPTLKGTVE